MIALLNYLPWIIIACGVFVIVKKPEWYGRTLLICFLLIAAIIVLTPSYLPKGTAQPMPTVEPPEQREIEARDDLRAPDPEVLERFEERADWKKQVEENKKPDE